jgi:hypothetical protein
MSLLNNYHTEDELAAELRAKTGVGSTRQLRNWRAQRIGPPWANLGKKIVYPNDGFEEWLRAQVHQPVRSRRAA